MNGGKRVIAWAAVFSMATVAASATPAKTIGILVFDGFLTSDVTALLGVLGTATKRAKFSSYHVIVVSSTRHKTVRSEEGLTIVADRTIYDDLALDVLIVPSSYSMDRMVKSKELVDFVKAQSRSASWTLSNCSGAQLLGAAGVLDGKRATTWAGGEQSLAASYPKIKVEFDTNVVVDDKVITLNGGAVSHPGALELLAGLSSKEFAKEVSESLQFPRLRSAFK
jgi:transcriptional regulator GlxA family with amidase domain